ncbi:putative two-component system sensor kinase/response regulator fusion protein [Fibrisoma limi BUZ 3]|uniref:histidine kinase n=1 Tax=Fibrisoma limi BUZ 3 TaxID=1185876 RepID=I2GME1_9BACT|nr:substrate-binding domain-containing protein [Fibrisoma limi]CCH55068.1 putative two-component system sensor kinase/response regulator fusion protein [Fibrisoma limi BUZ 3]
MKHLLFSPARQLGSPKGRAYQLLCWGFFVFVSVALSGCSETPQEPAYRIGFSQRTTADTWRKTMLEGMNRELSFYPGVDFIVKDAGGQSAKQVEQIQELIGQQIDLLIVSPNSARPITPIVEKAYQQGIPVIVLDRRTASDQYTAYVGADNVEVGRTAGIYAGALLDGKGDVIEIGESPGSSADIDRHRGFVEAIGRQPGIRLVGKLAGDWDKRSFAPELTRLLTTRPSIQLIFAQNDRTALKAYRVCQQLGLDKQIRIIGVDGLPGKNEGIDLVDRGILSATVLYPTGGKEAIRTAMAILQKQPFKRENRLPITLIDSTNVQIMKLQNDKVTEQQIDIERQRQRIDDLNRTYASQRNRLYITLVSLLIVIILGAYAWYLARAKQAAYQRLAQQNEEIRQQKDQIEAVSKQARQATEEKLRFYSYISHEFNTPLSLILTPTDELLTRRHLDTREVKNSLSLIQKNAHRLLRLVDQMLDLRKADAGKLLLRAQEGNVVTFIEDIVQDFRAKADKQRIDLRFVSTQSMIPLWFDREKLDKVLFNLLSNAFKYTPRGGFIHVHLAIVDEAVRIQVQDNGEGMTPEEQKRIFDLFYTGSTQFTLGNGLGLALSREFMTLHHGELLVQSEKGKGTVFTLQLPLGNAHLDPSEIGPIPDPHRTDSTALPVDDEWLLAAPDEQATQSSKVGTILIIEDHDELRQYLASRLGDRYDVVAEPSAEGGWERILETIPDLIISDIMLPGALDGLELTQRVKSDFRTSTIPVILLTAKGQMEERIEGTRAGADAYIAKPFQMAYLLETINTTLANREKWQKRYTGDYLAKTENRQEKKFLNELTTLIENHLTDPSFGVEQLSREMGLSRVQLYRKAQALLGKNVNEYFVEIRLKKAKALLAETGKPIAEIAYETGFSSPAYFTTFFKQHTQRTPSEFRKSPSVSV